MRIAICTRLRIPIFICNRANGSSFASCGMRQLCADAEDVALVWQNEHRHAVKTTESGHKRSSTHGGKEKSSRSLSRWSLPPKTFCTSNLSDKSHFSNLCLRKYSVISRKPNALTSTRVKCHWGTYWGVDGRHFPEVQPSMRKKTYSTGREGRGVTHTSRCLSVAVTAPQDRDLSLIMGSFHTHHWHSLKSYPIVFLRFFIPKKYNCLINGSNKSAINNTTQSQSPDVKKASQIKMCWASRWGLIGKGSLWHLQQEGLMRGTSAGNKMFPSLTAAVLTFPLCKWMTQARKTLAGGNPACRLFYLRAEFLLDCVSCKRVIKGKNKHYVDFTMQSSS